MRTANRESGSLRIWFDLSNSPHVNIFAEFIRDLQRQHEVVLTCRPLANTIELLDLQGFSYHVVGKHYGANSIKKGLGFFIRAWQLFRFLRDKRIDVAVSHSSFNSPLVARMLGARSVYINDNEHALGNRIAFQLADVVMVPEALSIQLVRRQNARGAKVIRYPGVKEGIYLQSFALPDADTGTNGVKTILVRTEPWTAQYYTGRKNFMDDLLLELADDEGLRVFVLPRGGRQKDHYKQARFRRLKVPEEPMSLAQIAETCDLFMGAGGTMTREAAVMGIPTISVYQDHLLEVDKFLIRRGLMVHTKAPSADFVRRYLRAADRRSPDRSLLSDGRDAYELIKKVLLTKGHVVKEGS